MMLEIDFQWTSTGSSGGLTPVHTHGLCMESVLYVAHSTLATTNSVSFQTAAESTGPWVVEATGTASTAASTAFAIRVTGPYKWMRPYIHTASTGDYVLRLTGVS